MTREHVIKMRFFQKISKLCAMVAVGAVALSTAATATAELPWPWQFHPHIDGYAARQLPTQCITTAQPGPVSLRNTLNFFWGTHSSSIPRNCSVAKKNSYHREARALDYSIWHTDPKAQQIIDFILESDEHGNPHARARRMGLEEIIWKNKIWSSDRPWWRTCSTCGPHYDHIHFSFSKAGAAKQTSWWTSKLKSTTGTCGGKSTKVEYWEFLSGYGPLRQVKSIKGYGGTLTTQSQIYSSPWRVRNNSSTFRATQPLSVFHNPRLVRGNCTFVMN